MSKSIHSMKHDDHVYHRRLPKASWVYVGLSGFSLRGRRFMRFRMANALSIWVFGIEIVIRRPWLAGPARQLHPELFKEHGHD